MRHHRRCLLSRNSRRFPRHAVGGWPLPARHKAMLVVWKPIRQKAMAFWFRFSIPGNGPACKGFWGYLPKKLGCGCLPGTIRTGKGAGRVHFDIVQLGHLRGCMVRKLGCTGGLPIPFWLLPYHLSGLFSCETSLDFFRAGDLVSKRVTTIWTIYGMSMTGMAR